ncbi:hypothetical protein SteCoe_10690 [Stentor coeruleus]|uniref:Uncharacterized protein n=1 Tax=Stentor coeruleus TaxID=5963 RepID=A0A1R2CEZ0_9CILI|nr:hypothetical protein SteCoe_10690 [Stentor coeruleus]
MDPKKQPKLKESDNSDEGGSGSEEVESEEEEEKSKQASDKEGESNTMRLRRNKIVRSVYNIRSDKKASRGLRGKKSGIKRGRAPSSRGRVKSKAYGDRDNSKRSDSESESEESAESCEYQNEIPAPTNSEKFLYKPGVPWPDLSPYLQQVIEIRVAREYLNPKNKQVVARNIWGNDVYTSDSDIVAMIHHVGLINIWQEIAPIYEGISVYTRITKGRANYVSCIRNRIRSKKFSNYEGYSIKPERVVYLNSLGKIEELIEMAEKMPTDYPKHRPKPNLNMKAMRIIPGTMIIFDLSFEPAYPYNLENFGDKWWNEAEFLSTRLKTVVVILETYTQRFELSLVSEGEEEPIFEHQDKYRWAQVNEPLMLKDSEFFKDNKVPLEDCYVTTVHKSLDWNEIEWSSSSVFVKKVEYGPIRCFKYVSSHVAS